MRNLTLVLAALLGVTATAVGDELVDANGLRYPDVTITDVRGGVVYVEMPGGVRTRGIDEIGRLAIDGKDSFNQAEQLLAADKPAEAVDAYDKAAAGAEGWFKTLVELRRLEALTRAGLAGRAVEEWMVIAERSVQADWAMAIRPTTFAPAGSDANAKAISTVRAALERVEDADYRRQLQQLLLGLYRAQEMSDEAASLAEELTGRPAADGEDGPPTNVLDAKLDAVEVLLDSGNPARAIETIDQSIDDFPPAQLAIALTLRGKARMALAEDASEAPARRDLLLEAGLDFMRVVTFYAESTQAPEALYLAGRVHQMLTPANKAAAGRAWQRVIQQYPDSEFADDAEQALVGLE